MFVRPLKQTGDTIVEVLLSIAVVSTILGGAYVVTNRSLISSRDAQERSGALKVTESQMERLKSLAATNPAAVFHGASPFCVRTADNTIVAASDASCKVSSSGSPTTVPPMYILSIARGANSTFTLTTTWEKVRGDGNNTLRMSYKVYE